MSFATDGDRKLIVANNPAKLLSNDLRNFTGDCTGYSGVDCSTQGANAAACSLCQLAWAEPYRVTHLAEGKYRFFAKVENATGDAVRLSMQFVNCIPGSSHDLRLAVTGIGFHGGPRSGAAATAVLANGGVELGARAISAGGCGGSQVFYAGVAAPPPWQSPSTRATSGQTATAIVDFDYVDNTDIAWGTSTNQTPLIKFHVIKDGDAFPASTRTSRIFGSHLEEQRGEVNERYRYKGVASASQVKAANVNYVFGTADGYGRLPVRYARWQYGVPNGSFLPAAAGDGFFSHATTIQSPDAIVSDLLPLTFRPYATQEQITYSPFVLTPPRTDFEHLTNIGVTYVITGSLQNTGGAARTVTVNLRAPQDGHVDVAYRNDADTWVDARVAAGTRLPYRTLTVQAGQTVNYTATYMVTEIQFPDDAFDPDGGAPPPKGVQNFLALED